MEADGCLRLSLRGKLEGGVTLRGEAGVFPPGALMKCVKISVCFRRKSNLLTLSCTYCTDHGGTVTTRTTDMELRYNFIVCALIGIFTNFWSNSPVASVLSGLVRDVDWRRFCCCVAASSGGKYSESPAGGKT